MLKLCLPFAAKDAQCHKRGLDKHIKTGVVSDLEEKATGNRVFRPPPQPKIELKKVNLSEYKLINIINVPGETPRKLGPKQLTKMQIQD